MSLLLFIAAPLVFLLFLFWILRDPAGRSQPPSAPSENDEFGRRHVVFLPQVRRALAAADFEFLASRGSHKLARSVRRERRQIVLVYLSLLRSDFLKLWQLARSVARTSPRVSATRELKRIRLAVVFLLRYEVIRLKVVCDFAPLSELATLGDSVSALALELETAMKELGERAALGAELTSTLNGRGLNAP